MKEEVLALENRRSLYKYIRNHPGSHLNKISRDLDFNVGTLRHHLDFMEKKRVIVSKTDRNKKAYFAAGKLTELDKRITPLLQQKRFRSIILEIIITPGTTHKAISEKLAIKPSTLSKYLKILHEREIIYFEKRVSEKRYHIKNEKEIVELLMTYKESFWDPFVDNMFLLYFER